MAAFDRYHAFRNFDGPPGGMVTELVRMGGFATLGSTVV